MRPKFLVISCSVLLIALLYTPGCSPVAYDRRPRPEDPSAADRDGGSIDDLPSPSETDAATSPDDAPSMPAQDTATARDAGSSPRTDAGSSPPADVGQPAEPLTEPVGFLLAPTTCHGRRLPASTMGLALAGRGARLWHFCYKTPVPATSGDRLARTRPRVVVVSLADGSGLAQLVRSGAPTSANPWTTSVLVAVPEDRMPLFNIVSFYEDGRSLSAIASGADGRFPLLNGELQSWSVESDGTQTAAPPDRACRTRLDPATQPVSFLPSGTCDPLGGDCPVLESLDCRRMDLAPIPAM